MHEFLPHTLLTLKMRTGWFDAKDKWSATSFVKTAQRLEYVIHRDKVDVVSSCSQKCLLTVTVCCADVSTW